jgi:enoyl-CoA hydratase/carnithine racemase
VTDHCAYRTEGALAHLELNRPQVGNALNVALLTELRDHLVAAEQARQTVVLLTGAGRNFCAGADRAESAASESGSVPARRDLIEEVSARLSGFPASVAAVQGAAVGGGWALALACDLCVAAPTATFSFPEIEHGIPMLPSTMAQLRHWVGPGVAFSLVAGGKGVTADRLAPRGLLEVVPEPLLRPAAMELAGSLAQRDPDLLRAAKADLVGGA